MFDCASAADGNAELAVVQLAPVSVKADPKSWLSMGDIFGPLASNPTYVAAFTTALASLWARGTRATLEAYLDNAL